MEIEKKRLEAEKKLKHEQLMSNSFHSIGYSYKKFTIFDKPTVNDFFKKK